MIGFAGGDWTPRRVVSGTAAPAGGAALGAWPPPNGMPYRKEVRIPYSREPMGVIGKVTAKGQTTIPRSVRAALHLKPGDLIVWEMTAEGAATVRRAQPLDMEYLRAVAGTLSEWASEADEEAYREL